MRKNKKISADFNHPEWNIEAYDLTREFIETNEIFPNNTVFMGNNYSKGFIGYNKFVDMMNTLNGEIIFKSTTYNMGPRKVYYFADDKYFVLENIHFRSNNNFTSVDENDNSLIPIIGSLTIMHKEEELDTKYTELIENCFLVSEEVPMIGIISRDQNGFFLNEVKMNSSVSNELNIHYGDGFDIFHEKLIEKLVKTNKGLTLLHGDPGTGKSSYIRKLVSDLNQKTNKKVIIVPNNLIGYLVDPEFNTFLLDTIESYQYEDDEFDDEFESDDVKGIILILEDAESVLLKREKGDSNQGTSNILNLTDGLLNDIFGIQIIATYNTTDDNIDPAIMRSKRLISKRTFSKLNIEQAKLLAAHIGVPETEINSSMSVADIYSLLDKETENILIQKESKETKIGFKI